MLSDLDCLKQQCEAGARLGYTGKQVIHPGQIDTVQAAFLPSQQQVERARAIVNGFNLSQQQGKVSTKHSELKYQTGENNWSLSLQEKVFLVQQSRFSMGAHRPCYT